MNLTMPAKALRLFAKWLGIVLLFAGITAFRAYAPTSKAYSADQFNVLMEVQPNGTLLVTETVVFRFEGGPFTYTFREISQQYTDGIELVYASMDGAILPRGMQPGQVEVVEGNPLKVIWHYPETSNSAHEFRVQYLVKGAIRTGEADTLIWNAIPTEHEYPIHSSTITFSSPKGISPIEKPTLNRKFTVVEGAESTQYVIAESIAPDQGVVLTVKYPAGSLTKTPPLWQQVAEQQSKNARLALQIGLGIGVSTTIAGILAGIWLMKQGVRRVENSEAGVFTQSIPPDDAPSALAARLIGSSTAFLGTFFDLAKRGILAVHKVEVRWGNQPYDVTLEMANAVLHPHEEVFLHTLFGKNKRTVNLNQLSNFFQNHSFNTTLDRELIKRGWYDSEQSARYGLMRAISMLGMIPATVLFAAGFFLMMSNVLPPSWGMPIGAALIGLSAALVIVFIIWIILSSAFSPLSEEGTRKASQWKSFKEYLHSVATNRNILPNVSLFETYLPYAAAFGLLDEWEKLFSQARSSTIPMPEWIVPLSTSPSSSDGDFLGVLSALNTVSDTSFISADAGASSASGGGASGAG